MSKATFSVAQWKLHWANISYSLRRSASSLCVCDNMNHTAKLMKPSGLIAVLDNLSLFKSQKDHFQLFTPYENVRLYTAADHRDWSSGSEPFLTCILCTHRYKSMRIVSGRSFGIFALNLKLHHHLDGAVLKRNVYQTRDAKGAILRISRVSTCSNEHKSNSVQVCKLVTAQLE